MASDIPFQMFRVWTHPRSKDSLTEIKSWDYPTICKANEWLDMIDQADAEEKRRAEMEAKSKR